VDSVQVLATEHGVADLHGKNPSERARITVEHCSASEYRDQLKACLAFARIEAGVSLVLRDPLQV
jgi:acyl-CoA hydrolase